MSCSVAISSFLRHEVSFWVCGSAILILSAIVFVRGRALSAILYPTPISILLGSRLRRYSPLETIVPETIVTGEYRAYRLGIATSVLPWTSPLPRYALRNICVVDATLLDGLALQVNTIRAGNDLGCG